MLDITQPALSRQITALEKRLGFILFTRTQQGVFLTPEGKEMFSVFSETHSKIQSGIERARSIQRKNPLILSIGYPQNWRIDKRLSALIDTCKNSDENIQIELYQLSRENLRNAINSELINIIFDINLPSSGSDIVDVFPIGNTQGYIMAPNNYPQKDSPEWKTRLSTETIFYQANDIENEILMEQFHAELGFFPQRTIPVNSSEAQQMVVKCGLGATLLVELSNNMQNDELNYFPIGKPIPLVCFIKKAVKPFFNNQFQDLLLASEL